MNIPTIRLIAQQLATSKQRTPNNMVSWMGAMQAQDYNMAKWAIGIRNTNCNNRMVETAFNKGEILRTHVMRPTWHFVTPENIRWMLELTAPRIKSSMRSRDHDLELSDAIYKKCNRAIQNALTGGKHLTKDELALVFENSGIPTDSSRIYHILMHAELDGTVCSGALREKKQTYALLEERCAATNVLLKDEALAKLAQAYFCSHSPATIQDFIWWSGLAAADAKHALKLVNSRFVSETIDSQIYWFSNEFCTIPIEKESVYLLPAYDEYLISYKNREAVISTQNHSKAVSSNGIFRPVIVENGKVVGLWKRTATQKYSIQLNFFEKSKNKSPLLVENAVTRLSDFYQK